MNGRPLSFPTWVRLWTGILGALVVSLAFFPIYVGGSMTTGVLGQRLHLYAAFELALPFWPRFWWLAFFPQLVFWVGFTVLLGSAAGSLAIVLFLRPRVA